MDGAPSTLRIDMFLCFHSDPRRLVVKIDAPRLALVVMVLHAPHSELGPQELTLWWACAIQLIMTLKVQPVLADANARFG